MKMEHVSTDPSLLTDEVEAYRTLRDGEGIPTVHWFGQQDEFMIIVFDLLGPSLEDLFHYCGRRFSLRTVLMLADQLLRRLEFLHGHDLVHRDVKAENFLMGTGANGNVVYVTDLGFAAEPRLQAIPEPDPQRPRRLNLIGTVDFASIEAHYGGGERGEMAPARDMLTGVGASPMSPR